MLALRLNRHLDAVRDLYLEERRQLILEQVNREGRASVAELSRAYGVSEVTIRADLQALAERALVVRTHGGAVPYEDGLGELALTSRRRRQVVEKSRIGRRAAALVEDGDAIFLDSSSTSLAIAYHLKEVRHATVITNALAVVQELLDAPDITVVMTGGRLDRTTSSLVNVSGLEAIRSLNIRWGFFGAHGISTIEGLTDVSADVAAVKRPFVAMCREVVAVLDATKWGRAGVASFAALEEVNYAITAHGAPAGEIAQVSGAGVNVYVV